jgi:hypothetical protein
VIFKRIGSGRPYPDHGRTNTREWADVAPRPVRLDQLVTTKGNLDLETLLAEDSTFYGKVTSTLRTACIARCGRRCSSDKYCTHECSK